MPRIPDAQVLGAAIEVMLRRGYAGATTKQIAEAAQINEVTLFRRFGTKANLLRKAMLTEVENFGGSDGIPYTGDLHADLTHVVRAYAELLRRRGRMVPMLFAELPRHPELREVVGPPLRMLESVGELVARYQREGLLESEPPMRAVAALLAPLLIPTLLGEHAPEALRGAWDAEEHVRGFLHGRAGQRA